MKGRPSPPGPQRAKPGPTPGVVCDRGGVPSTSTLLVFALAVGVVVAIPGPNHLYIVARSLTQGPRSGLASAFGVETGTLVHIAAAALGISSLIASSAVAFSVVKYAGAA